MKKYAKGLKEYEKIEFDPKEIIEGMPSDLQVKFLRVLQERIIEPVGGKISHKIDVRIIAATHRDLDDMVKKKLFREDLVFRIRVVEIELPSLRSRPEDIEPLVEHFTAVFNKKHSTKKYFQHKTLDTLKRYPWPGNIRELEGTIERHIILAPDLLIRPEHIESKFYEVPPVPAVGLTLGQFRQAHNRNLLDFLEDTIELSEGNKGNHLN